MAFSKFRFIELSAIGILSYLHHINAEQGKGYTWVELFAPIPERNILISPPTGILIVVMAFTLIGLWQFFSYTGDIRSLETPKIKAELINQMASITKEHIKFYLIMLFIIIVIAIIGHLIIKQLAFESWERNMAESNYSR